MSECAGLADQLGKDSHEFIVPPSYTEPDPAPAPAPAPAPSPAPTPPLPSKPPSSMSIKELKQCIASLSLTAEAATMNEKQQLVELVETNLPKPDPQPAASPAIPSPPTSLLPPVVPPPLTLIIDIGYGFPPNPKPRKERVNAVAKQTVNALQTMLASLLTDPPLFTVQVVGTEADTATLKTRNDTLLATTIPDLPPAALSYHTCPLPNLCDSSTIYLSPDAPPRDSSKSPPSRLIIGGIIDRSIQVDRSKNRAATLNIPAACLPLSLSHLALLQDSEPLNVDTVLEMCVSWRSNVNDTKAGEEYDDTPFVDAVTTAMLRHEERHPNRPVHKEANLAAAHVEL